MQILLKSIQPQPNLTLMKLNVVRQKKTTQACLIVCCHAKVSKQKDEINSRSRNKMWRANIEESGIVFCAKIFELAWKENLLKQNTLFVLNCIVMTEPKYHKRSTYIQVRNDLLQNTQLGHFMISCFTGTVENGDKFDFNLNYTMVAVRGIKTYYNC